ncbi:MAG: hypothetical protein HFF36_07810 [Coprobacillus sp.]|nr:hypothetical protein [Coprobacillus sp.]
MELYYTDLYYANSLLEYQMSFLNNDYQSININELNKIEIPNRSYFEFIKSYDIKTDILNLDDGIYMLFNGNDIHEYFYCQMENKIIKQILFDNEQISNLFHLIDYESEKDTIVYSRICNEIYSRLNLEKREDRNLLFAIEINDIETLIKNQDMFNCVQFQRINVLKNMDNNHELNFEVYEELESIEEME